MMWKWISSPLVLEKTIKKKIRIFKENPSSPALALHKLTGSLHETWSFSVEEDLRILFTYAKDGVILVDIGKHGDIY